MKSNHNPQVSVIIPLYNQAQYVSQAIDSILNQTYKNIETIIVNDGSTDNPHPILEKYKRAVTVIDQQNKGLAGARNTGIKNSHGEYIQFLDADDFLVKDKIERQLEFSIAEDAEITYCEVARYYLMPPAARGSFEKPPLDPVKLFINKLFCLKSTALARRPAPTKACRGDSLWSPGSTKYDFDAVLPRNVGEITDIFPHFYNLWHTYPTPIHTLLFKKTIFDRFGLFPEELKTDEDRYYLSILAAKGVVFKYFPFQGGYYRIHQGSMNFDNSRMMTGKIRYYQKLHKELGEAFIFEKMGHTAQRMMDANLTHAYLQAVADGVARRILKEIKKIYKEQGVAFDAGPIPSRFKRASFPRKLLAAYLRRWFKN